MSNLNMNEELSAFVQATVEYVDILRALPEVSSKEAEAAVRMLQALTTYLKRVEAHTHVGIPGTSWTDQKALATALVPLLRWNVLENPFFVAEWMRYAHEKTDVTTYTRCVEALDWLEKLIRG